MTTTHKKNGSFIRDTLISISISFFLIYGLRFLLAEINATNYLEHLSANGVLICKDTNSTFSVTTNDVMVTTDRYYLHLKPHGQKISYLDCEKK